MLYIYGHVLDRASTESKGRARATVRGCRPRRRRIQALYLREEVCFQYGCCFLQGVGDFVLFWTSHLEQDDRDFGLSRGVYVFVYVYINRLESRCVGWTQPRRLAWAGWQDKGSVLGGGCTAQVKSQIRCSAPLHFHSVSFRLVIVGTLR